MGGVAGGEDTELIFGSPLAPEDFNDNNVGKVLDNIHSYGASKLFSQVSWQACQRYDLDSRFLHYDTTSVNVYGNYANYAEATESTVAITHGHSSQLHEKARPGSRCLYLCRGLCHGDRRQT
jgi:transposase